MTEDVKIVALVPTRGDRHKMLQNMKRLMDRQTKPLHGMVIVDDVPVNPAIKDITFRYRTGLTRIFEQYPDCDLVALIEDDDYYHPDYLKTMCYHWIQMGRPSTFGYGDTYYYHLGLKAKHYQIHRERSSAFTTFMTRDLLNMQWPKDDYSFVDIDIWKQFPGKTVTAEKPLAIGIKGYQEGAHFGGIGHNANWATYRNGTDPDLVWLKSIVDPESFEFYKSIIDTL